MSNCSRSLLDAKPDQALVIPKTLNDFGALLDNPNVFNVAPGLLNIAADDFLITDAGWAALRTPLERNGYIWANDVYEGQRILDWNNPYEQIFYCNVVLEGLSSVDSTMNPAEFNRIKGTALFSRGIAFFHLAQLFCEPFLSEAAGDNLGIPLRLTADINAPVHRASIAETYTHIFADLTTATTLLPASVPFKTRPTRAAAAAILARAYLSCARYNEALQWANEALEHSPPLLRYSALANSGPNPFPEMLPNGNDEALYYAYLRTYLFNSNSSRNVYVPQATYESYKANDLRKTLFFSMSPNGTYWFSGSYISTSRLFTGPTVGEVYLVKAECLARLGQAEEAISILNILLENRFVENGFTPYVAADISDVTGLILQERRKELIGRGLRWSDLRRLNAEPEREIVVSRTVNGQTHRLAPGELRYVFPLPDEEVQLAGLLQNPR